MLKQNSISILIIYAKEIQPDVLNIAKNVSAISFLLKEFLN